MTSPTDSDNTLTNKTKQSLLWYTILPFTMHFIRFANSIILARLLSPDEFGIIGVITVILYYCDSFTDFGFARALIQKAHINLQHYYVYFSFNLIISLAFFISIQFFSTDIANYFDEPRLDDALSVFAFLFLITACNAGPQVKLKREMKFKQLAIIDAVKVIVSMSISLTLASNGFGFWAIIYAMLCAQIIAFTLTLITSRLNLKLSLQFSYLKELLNFSLWDFIGGQVRILGDSIDKLMIGKILGTTSLGFYDKAIGLARMPNDQLSLRLSNVSFSAFSRLQSQPKELERYFTKIIFINSFIMIPICIGLATVAESFTLVLLGGEWANMISCLSIISISYLFASLANPIIAMNSSMAKVKQQTLIRIMLTIFLVIGLYFTVPFGIEYAAFTILIFNIFNFIFSFLLLKSHSPFGWALLMSCLIPGIVGTLFMFMSIYLVKVNHNFISGDWDSLLIPVTVGIFSYCFSTLILPFKQLSKIKESSKNMLKNSVLKIQFIWNK